MNNSFKVCMLFILLFIFARLPSFATRPSSWGMSNEWATYHGRKVTDYDLGEMDNAEKFAKYNLALIDTLSEHLKNKNFRLDRIDKFESGDVFSVPQTYVPQYVDHLEKNSSKIKTYLENNPKWKQVQFLHNKTNFMYDLSKQNVKILFYPGIPGTLKLKRETDTTFLKIELPKKQSAGKRFPQDMSVSPNLETVSFRMLKDIYSIDFNKKKLHTHNWIHDNQIVSDGYKVNLDRPQKLKLLSEHLLKIKFDIRGGSAEAVSVFDIHHENLAVSFLRYSYQGPTEAELKKFLRNAHILGEAE